MLMMVDKCCGSDNEYDDRDGRNGENKDSRDVDGGSGEGDDKDDATERQPTYLANSCGWTQDSRRNALGRLESNPRPLTLYTALLRASYL
ncbi:hypothetical protein PoB_002833600 [Plakobranchus ocellatus]|uniref:Uncharacterized protein n=1 Tax=Plakobranchus ocellatus TaxID=259542 RepID=A0AAV4A5B7_9GAST|nr:hypothetical protein PoB_002833600 [Plakobranchus ocellatus]